MTTPTQPTALPADGNLRIAWAPALTDPKAPKLTELSAASVVDLSCYLTEDGYSPSMDQQMVADSRLCSTSDNERIGRFKDGLDLVYVYQPQADVSATDNKAFTTLRYRTTGFIVARWGKAFDLPWTVGDIVDVTPAQCGQQMKNPPEANSRLRVTQKIGVTSQMLRDVAVVA